MSESDSACCKIGYGIKKYECSGLNDKLVRGYRNGDASLRDLEKIINEEFTAAALRDAGSPAGRNPSDITAVLQGQEGSRREKARLETQLEQAGIDVEQLEQDHISFRTVKTHLNEHLNVNTSRNESITLESASSIIEWAETRCTSVIERTIERLSNAGKATIGDNFTVNISPHITCYDCNSTIRVKQLIEENGCNCSPDDPE